MKPNFCNHKEHLRIIDLGIKPIPQVFNDVYFRLDANGIILDYQVGERKTINVPSTLFLGKQLQIFLPRNVSDRFEEVVKQVMHTQSLRCFEYSLRLPEGQAKYEVRILPLPKWQILVFFRKIDNQIPAEAEQFFQMSLDMLCTINFEFSLQQINSAWSEILGWTEIKIGSIPLIELVHPDDRKVTLKNLVKAVKSKDKITFENRIRCQDGAYKWMSWKLKTQFENQLIYAVVCDISDHKQTEEALKSIALEQTELCTQSRIAVQNAQEKVEQIEETLRELQHTQSQLIQTEKMSSLGQLVAGIAHEINNPINFIYANISHAQGYVKDLLHLVGIYEQHYSPQLPEIQEKIAKIDLAFLRQDLPKIWDSMNHGAERIRQTVLSLRNFSRVDETGMKRVNIHEGIENTLHLLQHRLNPQSGYPPIQVIKDYGNLPKVFCDAGQMNQVFMHLLNNAVDALEELGVSGKTTDKPTIFIRTFLEGDRLLIRIADNGVGITEESRHRLFDPFFTTKPVGKGTGLGLSISYQIIVKQHRGKLHCISTPGQGAEFAIAIPYS